MSDSWITCCVQVMSTTGRERYSTAFFMDADFDCIVDTADIPACQVSHCGLRGTVTQSVLIPQHHGVQREQYFTWLLAPCVAGRHMQSFTCRTAALQRTRPGSSICTGMLRDSCV